MIKRITIDEDPRARYHTCLQPVASLFLLLYSIMHQYTPAAAASCALVVGPYSFVAPRSSLRSTGADRSRRPMHVAYACMHAAGPRAGARRRAGAGARARALGAGSTRAQPDHHLRRRQGHEIRRSYDHEVRVRDRSPVITLAQLQFTHNDKYRAFARAHVWQLL